jgi:hypothetical protein
MMWAKFIPILEGVQDKAQELDPGGYWSVYHHAHGVVSDRLVPLFEQNRVGGFFGLYLEHVNR